MTTETHLYQHLHQLELMRSVYQYYDDNSIPLHANLASNTPMTLVVEPGVFIGRTWTRNGDSYINWIDYFNKRYVHHVGYSAVFIGSPGSYPVEADKSLTILKEYVIPMMVTEHKSFGFGEVAGDISELEGIFVHTTYLSAEYENAFQALKTANASLAESFQIANLFPTTSTLGETVVFPFSSNPSVFDFSSVSGEYVNVLKSAPFSTVPSTVQIIVSELEAGTGTWSFSLVVTPPILDMNGIASTFVADAAVMGFTSTINEELSLRREDFVQVYEEHFSQTEYVLQIVMDINTALHESSVKPPQHELSFEDDTVTRVSFGDTGKFEKLVKGGSAANPDDNWYSNRKNNNEVTFGAQVKALLGYVFDKNKELNNILGGQGNSIVFLDDTKIKTQLDFSGKYDQVTTLSYETPEYNNDGSFDITSAAPVTDAGMAVKFLSTRQIVQCLEAFSSLGTYPTSDSGRVIHDSGIFKYALRHNDSIIGKCTVKDLDTGDNGTEVTVKIQLIQSQAGSYLPASSGTGSYQTS